MRNPLGVQRASKPCEQFEDEVSRGDQDLTPEVEQPLHSNWIQHQTVFCVLCFCMSVVFVWTHSSLFSRFEKSNSANSCCRLAFALWILHIISRRLGPHIEGLKGPSFSTLMIWIVLIGRFDIYKNFMWMQFVVIHHLIMIQNHKHTSNLSIKCLRTLFRALIQDFLCWSETIWRGVRNVTLLQGSKSYRTHKACSFHSWRMPKKVRACLVWMKPSFRTCNSLKLNPRLH